MSHHQGFILPGHQETTPGSIIATVAAVALVLFPLAALATPSTTPLPAAAAHAASVPGDAAVARPQWVAGLSLSSAGAALLEALEQAARHGLNPADYAPAHIRAMLDHGDMTATQQLLDKAFVRFAGDLTGGRGSRLSAPHTLLKAAAWSPEPQDFLAALSPAPAAYHRLKTALADLNAVAANGGWPQVPDGPTLREGDSGPAVKALRNRLIASRDMSEAPPEASPAASPEAPAGIEAAPVPEPAPAPPGETFDAALLAAVQRFQARHGLGPDGVVGPATRAALNVSAAERTHQVAINLDRLRRAPPLPDNSGLRVEVNLAAYDLVVRQGSDILLRLRVAVGRPDTATPVMRDSISSVVFNPHWYVPHSIAIGELLPREAANPGVLAREGYEIFGEGDPPRLRQKPGPRNALGRIKFSFPNTQSIYLHDTNAQHIFQASRRAVSHGCVRVEQPADLAALLLQATGTAPPETVAERLDGEQSRSLALKQPVPIDLAYHTAWVEPDGTLNFRPDIYGLDTAIAAALNAPRQPLSDTPMVALD